jgi:hypothetical protein
MPQCCPQQTNRITAIPEQETTTIAVNFVPETRFTRFLKRRSEAAADQPLNQAIRFDLIAARPEHERLRMGI